MRDAKSRISVSTEHAGSGRFAMGGSSTPRALLAGFDGSGAPAGRQRLTRAMLLVGLCVLTLGLVHASNAAAEYAHTTTTGKYGKTGPSASGLGNGCFIAWQSEMKNLYLLSDAKIYVLNRPTPGTVSPLATINAGINSFCTDQHLAVDNGSGPSKGNVYAVPSNGFIYGWTTAGAALPGFPAGPGSGEVCGVAATNNGQVWGGYYGGGGLVVKRNADGSDAGTITPGLGSNCKIAIDNSNNDLYVISYSGGGIWKLTAAGGYTSPVKIINSAPYDAGVAINGATDRIYVPNGSMVKSYDTNTGALKETIEFGGFTNSVAVDEATDTLFVSDTGSGFIREIPGANVPKAITGEPVGNKKVSGTAELNGAGPITECFFEWGLSSSPGYSGGKQACNEVTPFAGTQAVTANLPLVESEQAHRYRLLVCNAEAGGCAFGGEKTITPHAVPGLKTEAATSITRKTATLNASFEGNNKETSYYFEWGLTNSPYANKTPTPPGTNVGSPVGPTSIPTNISGLVAGTTYHYRVVAINEEGQSKGEDKTFVTSPAVKALNTEPATDVTLGGATLNASLDPDNFATTYYFQWGKSTGYGQELPAAPGVSVGTTAPGQTFLSQPLTDLESGVVYHYRIVATNSEGTTFGADQSFTTPQTPSINSFSSTNVTGTSAELVATINPNGYATTYYFEYGTSLEYGHVAPVPEGAIPAGNTSVSVNVPVSGLSGVTYHFRLTAVNKWGQTRTSDQTFDFNPPIGCPNHTVRQQTGAAFLPDCRAYELVSAPQAGGAGLFPNAPASAYASSPGRFAYVGLLNAIPGSGEPTNAGFAGDMYVASRSPEGWVTKYVGIPGNKSIGQSGPPGGEWGSAFGLLGILGTRDQSRFLVWDRKHGYEAAGGTLDGSYAPWVIDNSGNYLGRFPTNVDEIPHALDDVNEGGFKGAVYPTPDFSHYVFSSINTAFAPGGRTAAPGDVYDNDTVADTVDLVSKLPNGEPIPQDKSAGNAGEYIKIPAVSDDGSHILMSTQAPSETKHLYMAVDDTHYYEVSVDSSKVNKGVKFEGMTKDGNTVYFSTANKMTADDADTSTDLYKWTAPVPDEEGNLPEAGQVTRVSVGSLGTAGNVDSCSASWIGECGIQVVPIENHFTILGQGPNIDSNMATESGDIYFYSPEQLDAARGEAGKRNLYVYRNGVVKHVATLQPFSGIERMNVVPSGAFAAFITGSKLTSYENSGVPEMYTYDAAAGSIRCVSCIPSGGSPTSVVEGAQDGRFLTDDGRAFFSTGDALVSQDANGIRDVYEFVDSRPQLISTGTGDTQGNFFQPIGLVGVSANGIDVMFSTYETLVGQDENGFFLKFYDARTNGGIPFEKPPAPCAAADECHGPDSQVPAPPQIGTTAGLGSGGNLSKAKKRCKKPKSGKKKKSCGKRRKAEHHRRGRNG